MKLSRQLVLLMLGVITLLLVVSLVISFNNTKQFVENQMVSHAQDAATSLGMSASTAMKDNDEIITTTLVNAMFHAGDYQLVQVFDVHNQLLVERSLDVQVEGIPRWFISVVELELPIGESVVMDGWAQAGKIQVISHPGYAYRKLWNALIDTFKGFIISALLILLISLYLLKRVLYPLAQIESQAIAISNRKFDPIDPVPETIDLKRIVEAMNHLAQKVGQMLKDADERAQQFRDRIHRDEVTGLSNRQHFNEVLEHRMMSSDSTQHGILALIQLYEFKQFNDKHGYVAGDELLKKTAQALASALDGMESIHIAHLSGASFSVFAEDMSFVDAGSLAKTLTSALATLSSQMQGFMDVGHIGVACFDGNQTVTELLSMADVALRDAQSESANSWCIYQQTTDDTVTVRTASQWRDTIESALNKDWLVLQKQAVFRMDGKTILHEEVYLRLLEDGDKSRLMDAGKFMPMVQSLGLAAMVDRKVIEKALLMLSEKHEGILAVNVSPVSLDDADFVNWLEKTLLDMKDIAVKLILEFSEYGIVKKLDRLKTLQQRLGATGVQFSLDHFGRGFTSFAYLQSLDLQYIKIDGSYVFDLKEDSENSFYIRGLTEIAHGLDIVVIAESVESQSVWEVLPKLKVDAGQGYYLAKPA
ncbi:MAG: EAL domain-containing protein [Gammaproteobacteria bacterium]|nr:EAL domain-containing protein [Gammaproteobacteria bacterium]